MPDIDPFTLTNEQAGQLFTFFGRNALFGRTWHLANKLYSTDNKTSFTLKYDVLQCPAKNPEKGMRYHFVGGYVDRGTHSRVYRIVGTLRQTEDGFVFKTASAKTGMAHYLKEQWHNHDYPFETAQMEAIHMGMAGYTDYRPPVLDKETMTSRMVIRQRPGKNLLQIFQDHATGRRCLTNAQRLELSVAILEMADLRLESRELLHGDVAPDNIMVDLDAKPMAVSLIDFGLARKVQPGSQRVTGKVCYFAPELLTYGTDRGTKSEVFSVGRILAFLWGACDRAYVERISVDDYYEIATHITLDNLYTDCEPLHTDAAAAIRKALLGMLRPNPDERSGTRAAIAAFRKVNLNIPNLRTLIERMGLFSPPPATDQPQGAQSLTPS